jgi:DUF1680 family protein
MAGRLDEFWPDVRDSAWIGGPADGWERAPYWLDAVVPLAYLTGDEVLQAKVRRWIDYILEHQREDGEMGPESGDPSAEHFDGFGDYDAWPRMILLKALLQFHSATGDPRVVPAALRLVRRIDEELIEHPLHEWGRVRWADLVLSINELYDLTGEDWLPDVAARVASQGYDWADYAVSFPYREKVTEERLRDYERDAGGIWMNDHFLGTHGANVAMGVKTMPVWWRNSGDEELRDRFISMLENLDRFHGQVTGVFTADEHLAGRSPVQGTETCTVVELMFSLETALETWGYDEAVLDRLERVAYNALPASARSDEWGHQYDQQANQVICHVTEDRVYTNNGPDANVFGLEPHFGCCTANRHQGWPKLAARLWARSPDDGLLALSYAPCTIETDIRGNALRVDVTGQYPFDDRIEIRVKGAEGASAPLHFRVPAWAVEPRISVDGAEPIAMAAGVVFTVDRDWSGEHVLELEWDADIRERHGLNGSVSLSRGPIVFVAPVEEEWKQIGGELPHATWAIEPTSPWNVAILHTPGAPRAKMARRILGEQPFTPEGAPVALEVEAGRVQGWQLERGAAAPQPTSPLSSLDAVRSIALLPYGAARLRVTELPWADPSAVRSA